jgi:hypothetical protein
MSDGLRLHLAFFHVCGKSLKREQFVDSGVGQDPRRPFNKNLQQTVFKKSARPQFFNDCAA